MYLSFVLVGFAAAVATNSIWYAAATVVLVVLLQVLVIKPEEEYLSARFPQAYARYLGNTRRWL